MREMFGTRHTSILYTSRDSNFILSSTLEIKSKSKCQPSKLLFVMAKKFIAFRLTYFKVELSSKLALSKPKFSYTFF